MPSRTPTNGLDIANQKEIFQPESFVLGFVFTLFSKRSTIDISANMKSLPDALAAVHSTTGRCPFLRLRLYCSLKENQTRWSSQSIL